MDFRTVLKIADEKGMKAFNACVPEPVSWVSTDLFDKPLGKPSKPDTEGECGGAYITAIPGKSPFVNWCKKNDPDLIRKGVYKGYDMYLSVKGYNGQSREKKTAYAEAFAKVLKQNGIICSIRSYQT